MPSALYRKLKLPNRVHNIYHASFLIVLHASMLEHGQEFKVGDFLEMIWFSGGHFEGGGKHIFLYLYFDWARLQFFIVWTEKCSHTSLCKKCKCHAHFFLETHYHLIGSICKNGSFFIVRVRALGPQVGMI